MSSKVVYSYGLIAIDKSDFSEYIKNEKEADNVGFIMVEEKARYAFKEFLLQPCLYMGERDIISYISRNLDSSITKLEKRLLTIFFSFTDYSEWSEYCIVLTETLWGKRSYSMSSEREFSSIIEKNFNKLYKRILSGVINRDVIKQSISRFTVLDSVWGFPKGHRNKDENMEIKDDVTPAVREFLEETNIPCHCLCDEIICAVHKQITTPTCVYICKFFLVLVELDPDCPSTGWRWTMSQYSTLLIDCVTDQEIISGSIYSDETISAGMWSIKDIKMMSSHEKLQPMVLPFKHSILRDILLSAKVAWVSRQGSTSKNNIPSVDVPA